MRPAFFLSLVFVSCFLRSQNFDSACLQQKQVITLLTHLHYDPPAQDHNTAREVVDLFLRNADEKNIFFMRDDTAALYGVVRNVPATDAYCQVINLSYFIFTRRLAQLDSIAGYIDSSHLALDGKDTLNFVYRRRDRQYCASMNDLYKRVEKRVKYDALQYLFTPPAMMASASVLREERSHPQVHKAQSRSVQKFRRSLARFREQGRILTHLSDCMSNAIAGRCDPHSNYLNNTELLKYRNALSTHERSFGFSVGENKSGEHILTDLVPGGPAWKSEDLSENDVIAALFIGGTQLPLADMDADEINAQLHGESGEDVSITVIGSDLQVRTVSFNREKIQSVDNALNSYVVTTGGKRIGFIPIPSFYMDQEHETRQGLTNDVAKEIVELKRDSVEGIIIDLRFNGGGSMREAIALAGLFIDQGPVAIYRHRGEQPFLLKDVNRGTAWDGPLLVLINSASASAAEFVTAALQDHNRAVIAGSESFGKGTAQNLLPADTGAVRGENAGAFNGGYLKITGGKFYRLNARSHQGKGIVPDIAIPGIIEKILEREASYPFALPCDSVDKKVTFTPLKPLPVKQLSEMSSKRINGNPRFARITALADSLSIAATQTEKVPLSPGDFKIYTDRQKKLNQRMEALFKAPDTNIAIRNNSSNTALLSISRYLKRTSDKTIESLEQDVTFQEGVYIMSDLIDLVKK